MTVNGFIRQTVIGLLAAVGAVAILWHFIPVAFRAASGGPRTPEYVRYFPSPDGKWTAALVSDAGGGGISPYCHNVVSLIPASASDRDAADSRFEVFSGECQSFALRGNAVPPSPQIEWLSENSRKITLSINATAIRPATVRMKKQDASGQVRIEFVAHE
jgi:hypothetical protein